MYSFIVKYSNTFVEVIQCFKYFSARGHMGYYQSVIATLSFKTILLSLGLVYQNTYNFLLIFLRYCLLLLVMQHEIWIDGFLDILGNVVTSQLW